MNSKPDGPLVTTVITDEVEWESIRSDWDELHAASPTASPALHHDWLRNWWEIYKSTLRQPVLRVVTVRHAARLVAAMPLFVHHIRQRPFDVRRLGFISTGEAHAEAINPEYLNMLHLPGHEADGADAVWQAVARMKWDLIDLVDLPDDTPLLRAKHTLRNIRVESRGQCPVADLTRGFDAYLEQLSSKRRREFHRLIRGGEEAGARFELIAHGRARVEHNVEHAGANSEHSGSRADQTDPDELESVFDDLVRLHQDRWTASDEPGVFAAPRFTEFHRRLVREWIPKGRAVMARLSIDSEAIAVAYGFVDRQKFNGYQSGARLDAETPVPSPGTLCHLLTMRALAEGGITAYDFMRGAYSYKTRMSTRSNELIRIQAQRVTGRRLSNFAARLGWRPIRMGIEFAKQIAARPAAEIATR